MTVTLPEDLQQALSARASQQRIPLEDLVCQALRWYLHTDPTLQDELTAWEEIRDEALKIVEESPR